jgi:hypothetical protein
MVTSLRSKWAVGKAVRAGLAVEGASRPGFVLILRASAIANGDVCGKIEVIIEGD